METKNVVEMLDEITEYRFQIEMWNNNRERKIDELIPQEIKDQLQVIEQETLANVTYITEKMNELEAIVREQVLLAKETVKGKHMMAVYSKGAASWNNDKLEGYAAAHPEVMEFKNPPKPSVSLRKL